MLVTPQNFEGTRRTDYVEFRIKNEDIGNQVYRYPRNALAAKTQTAQEIGHEIRSILEESGRAILLTEIRLPTGMHAIGIGFNQNKDGRMNAVYLDSTGNKTPKDLVPFLTQLIAGAGLQDQTSLETSIPTQQHIEQPNTCMLWLVKNTYDFLNNGEVTAPESTKEADILITPEMENYLTFEKTTTVDPNAGFNDYIRYENS